jgi:hypothetical protein
MNIRNESACRLRSLNTSSCNMEMRDRDSRNIVASYSVFRGAGVPLIHRACLVGSGSDNDLLVLSCAANATFARGDFND